MRIFLAVILSLLAINFAMGGNLVLAADPTGFDANLKKTATETGHLTSTTDKGKSIEQIIQTVIGAILSFLGVGFLLLMIYGGYVWMVARGNEQDVTKAKSIITNAIIGLIVVMLAYAVSYFVISKFVSPTAKQQTTVE